MHRADATQNLRNLILADVGEPFGDQESQEFVESGDAISVANFFKRQLGAVQAG